MAAGVVAISVDSKGAWRDNVFVERLARTIKYEEVYLRAYDSVSQARASIARYLAFYNGGARIRALTSGRPTRSISACNPWRQPHDGRRAILLQLWSGYALPTPQQNRKAPRSA
jgi:putative transposase